MIYLFIYLFAQWTRDMKKLPERNYKIIFEMN